MAAIRIYSKGSLEWGTPESPKTHPGSSKGPHAPLKDDSEIRQRPPVS